MKKQFLTIDLLVIFWLSAAAPAYCQPAPSHRWIVKLTETASPAARGKVAHALRSVPALRLAPLLPLLRGDQSPASSVYVLEGSAGDNIILPLLDSLQRTGMLDYYERDHIGHAAGFSPVPPRDPDYPRQWYLYNDGTFYDQAKKGADIKIEEAWQMTQGDSSTTVAILDSGIDPSHPEFAGRFWQNAGEIPDNHLDDDGNGYIDDLYGWDFVHEQATPYDDNGHGTAVAGVMAANANNGLAVAGINWRCKIMVCKVLDSNLSGFYSGWAAGIYYAVKQGADVINMSVEGEATLRTLAEAIQYAHQAGVLVVCSTGNQGIATPQYPAAYPTTLAVGATDPNDQRSDFSNFGEHTDLVAPGNYLIGLGAGTTQALNYWSGTSMACAVVSGVASLLLAMDTTLSDESLKLLLIQHADDQVGLAQEDLPGSDQYYGFGRVNAYQSVMGVRSGPSVPAYVLTLSPNPTSGPTTLSLILPMPTPFTLQVTDAQGRIVFRTDRVDVSSRSLSYTLDLSGQAAAVYFVSLQTAHQKYVSRLMLAP